MEVNDIDPDLEKSPEISTATTKIIEEIKSLEKELGAIQESCPHQKYTVKNFPESSGGSFCLKRICDLCSTDLGHPTGEECDRWMNS